MESLLIGYHDSAMSLKLYLNYLSQNNIIEFLFLENALHLSKIMVANGAHDKISSSFSTLTTILLK